MDICVMTLGCKVNKYESDAIVYNLKLSGHNVFDTLSKADLYIINTCAVTSEAEKKSRQMIARCKKFNPNARVMVCGCASQHNPQSFKEKGVQFVGGVAKKMKIANNILSKAKKPAPVPLRYEDTMIAQASRTRAYIKIQDGCNNFCSYCLIPYLRGRSRSRGIVSIINEASQLPESIHEIVLTGINVTDYKIDGVPSLYKVIEELDKLGKRVRLSSLEESITNEDFVVGLSQLQNFCPHFHLSLQSGSDSVLKRMNRHYTSAEFESAVKLIRKYFPLASITTDVIVGFPGETDAEFEETKAFIEKVEFASLHIFQYSKREGTVASCMKDLAPEVKQKRFEVLNEMKKELNLKFIQKNKHGKVLVEEKQGEFYVGYTENYIKCYISSKVDLTNQIVDVKIKKPYMEGALCKIV